MEDSIETVAVAMNTTGTAPDWIELVPAGRVVRGRDRREWFNTNPQGIIDAFNADRRDILLDWEHGSELNAPKGERAPAAGWIEGLELRAGAIWGRVRWTPKGGADVAERGYRYVSPTFLYHSATREIGRLKSAALVHTPNLELTALNRTENTMDEDMDKIVRALSLDPAKASIAGILSAIEKLRNGEGASAMNAAQDMEGYVPRRDYELAIAQLQEYRERDTDRREAEIEEAVNSVIAVGDPSFPPARREEYIAMCRERGGLERFREIMVPDASRSLALNAMEGRTAPSRGSTVTAAERDIYETMGVDPTKVRN